MPSEIDSFSHSKAFSSQKTLSEFPVNSRLKSLIIHKFAHSKRKASLQHI